jgi:predicted GIY-YIG superfamily endonuclease
MIESISFKHDLLFSVNAENLYSTILPKTKGSHLYYILNLKTGVVKFGISNDVRARMVVHVGNFTCYGMAQLNDLIISCSQDSIINAKDAETRLMEKASNYPLFKLIGGKEFFLYAGKDTSALDVFFSDFIGAQELVVENNFSDKQLRNKTKMPNSIKR